MPRARPYLLSYCICLALVALPAGVAAAADPILPLSQVQAGMQCTGETVIQGTAITSFSVSVLGVVEAPPSGAMILVSVSGPAVGASGVAQGFSGSPIFCPGAGGTPSIIGAISQGIGQYGNAVVLATPIERMLGEPVTPPSSAPRLRVRTHSLIGPLMVSGLSPALTAMVVRAGRRAGRLVQPAPVGGSPSYPLQPLVPGAAVAAAYSTGAVTLAAVGTVTYQNGSNVYAFGHELDGAGRRSLFLEDAYVYGVIDNPSAAPDGSYKLAAPGHVEGTLTSDTPSAVIGEVGAPPPSIPVDITARDLDTGQILAVDSNVADETDVGFPTGDLLTMVAPMAAAQAATQIYDGPPANESGSMCLRIDLRESRKPLGFCNRYVANGFPGDQGLLPPALATAVGGDVSTALSLVDSVQFAALHVTRVLATIDARRGLVEGAIVRALSPHGAVAGRSLRVRLLVRRYQGSLETVSFRLRIPRGLHGPVLVSLRGPLAGGPGGGGSLSSSLTAALGGGAGNTAGGPPSGAAPGSAPGSVGALRRQVAAVAQYDGLSATFLGGRGGKVVERHAYRNRALLITGTTTLFLSVRRIAHPHR